MAKLYRPTVNPVPDRIHPEMWRFWLEVRKTFPDAQLGGMWAVKPGYHSSASMNRSRWPGNYSVRAPRDRRGWVGRARAVDLTPGPKTLHLMSKRLLASGRDRRDSRIDGWREFFGTTDGKRVVGWDFQKVAPSSSDTSHLWHLHLSICTDQVGNRKAYDGMLAVLRGDPK